MIAIADETGALLKTFLNTKEQTFGFHRLFGFLSETNATAREHIRKRRGLKADRANWKCRFAFTDSGELKALEGCQAKKIKNGQWNLETGFGSFQIIEAIDPEHAHPVLSPARIGTAFPDREHSKDEKKLWLILAALFLLIFIWSLSYHKTELVTEEIPEPVIVNIQPEKAVVVPKLTYQENAEISPKKIQDQQVRRAVQQDLGFLGLLGKKNLTKAIGGMPTDLKDVSPGAGPGGKEGSGGEVLVGLGEGVKRVTVGNTGLKGLGGIGTKGAGGGAGGYGNSMVGSGEGKGLSSIPLSEDLVLEGGLDRSVIQATIAKYLSQVRACYEAGLKGNPGLTGQVGMDFEIAGSGNLNFARVYKSSLGHSGVEQCIATRMMGWKFPKPLGGVNVKVKYPFLLRPVGG